MAAWEGFEPPKTVLETAMLPITSPGYYLSMILSELHSSGWFEKLEHGFNDDISMLI